MTWAATNAKAKFSEMLDKAESEGPQLVRRRKQEFVLSTREEHEARGANTGMQSVPFVSAWDALQPSSEPTFDLDLPKRNGKLRAAKF